MNLGILKNKCQKAIPYLKDVRIVIAVAIMILTTVIIIIFSATKTNEKAIIAGQQVWSLADGIRQYYRTRPDAWGLSTLAIAQSKIAGAGMIVGDNITNALGKEVLIGADSVGNVVMPGGRSFVITYKNLNYDECVEIASQPLNEKQQLSLTSMVIANDTESRFIWGGENLLPISPAVAKDSCRKNNLIAWFLYI